LDARGRSFAASTTGGRALAVEKVEMGAETAGVARGAGMEGEARVEGSEEAVKAVEREVVREVVGMERAQAGETVVVVTAVEREVEREVWGLVGALAEETVVAVTVVARAAATVAVAKVVGWEEAVRAAVTVEVVREVVRVVDLGAVAKVGGWEEVVRAAATVEAARAEVGMEAEARAAEVRVEG
jgi:hypothetical protein